MHPLDRKLLRDLWRMKGMALAIALVIGAGLATFVMSIGALRSLDETRAAYYERYRFADIFATVKRAPQSLAIPISRLPYVKSAQTRIVKDVILDVPGLTEPATGRLISIPETRAPSSNDIVIRSGRRVLPGRPDEVVVSEAFAEAHGFGPGDSVTAIINGRKRALDIVGTALSPEYVYSIAPGALMPDDARFGVMWMGEEALAAAFDLEEAFNDVTVTMTHGVAPDETLRRIDLMLEPYGGTGAITRKDQTSNWFLAGELEQLRTMATIMPTIFLAVSMFLLNLVVARVVETEREQIGLLKAFGYSNLSVGWHYLKFVLAVVAVGIVAGSLCGAWLAHAITEIYSRTYRFPFLYFELGTDIFAIGAGIAVLAAALGTVRVIRRAAAVPPAVAMAPPTPPLYRAGLLSASGLSTALDQPSLMILRHVTRWPARSGLTMLGIAFAVAVLVSTLHWLDAIDYMLEFNFFRAQRQDVTLTTVEPQSAAAVYAYGSLPGVLSVEAYRTVPARFRAGPRVQLQAITGITPNAALSRSLDMDGRVVEPPPGGLVLSKKLAELLNVGPGDSVAVEILEGRRPKLTMTVHATVDTYLGKPAYMHIDTLNRLMKEAPAISGAYLLVDAQAQDAFYRSLKETPRIAGVGLRAAMIQSFRETLAETINFIVFFYVLFASLLATGVVYNAMRISLSERGRDLASLRVLGFTRGEVSYILLGEIALLTAFALPLGCLIGYGLSFLMTDLFETELYRIPMVIEHATYGYSVAVVMVASALCGLLVRRRIDRLDLVAALRTRE